MARCVARASLMLAAAGVAADEVALRGSGKARQLIGVALNGNWNSLANEWSADVVFASTICVRSVGGYLMSFNVWDTWSNFVSLETVRYPSPQTQCVEISEIPGVEDGRPVAPRIFILGYSDGHVQTAIQSVIYKRGAGLAQYTCLGSTFSFYCNLETQGVPRSSVAPEGATASAALEGADQGGRGLNGGVSSQFNGAFSPFAEPWSAAVVYASEVCVRNKAGYALRFKLWDTDTNLASDFTDDFSAGFTKCLQVGDLLFAQRGHPISPRVFVLGYQDGMVQVAQQSVIYDPEAGQAIYECRGTVGGWWCERETGAVLLL